MSDRESAEALARRAAAAWFHNGSGYNGSGYPECLSEHCSCRNLARTVVTILAPALEERDETIARVQKHGIEWSALAGTRTLERDKALRTIESLACMLGWGNVPPRDSLERSISALKAKLARLEDPKP